MSIKSAYKVDSIYLLHTAYALIYKLEIKSFKKKEKYVEKCD